MKWRGILYYLIVIFMTSSFFIFLSSSRLAYGGEASKIICHRQSFDILDMTDWIIRETGIAHLYVREKNRAIALQNILSQEKQNFRNNALFFFRPEPGLTDRLCVAICNPKDQYLVVNQIELKQFDSIAFRGNINITIHGCGMKLIEIHLQNKIYNNMEAYVAGLEKGEPEAVAFQKKYAFPSLEELSVIASDKVMGPSFHDIDPRLFLSLSKCQLIIK